MLIHRLRLWTIADSTLHHRHVFIKVCSEALLCWSTILFIQCNQIQESRENYYYYSTTKENYKFANSELHEKSQNLRKLKHANITRSTVLRIKHGILPPTNARVVQPVTR